MDRTTGRGAYRAVRDILVRHRDYDAAVAAFRWPDIGGRFNWALDWFDSAAAGNPRTLRIIGERRLLRRDGRDPIGPPPTRSSTMPTATMRPSSASAGSNS
jgi:hypothetical protein